MSDMHRLDFKRGTVEQIDSATSPADYAPTAREAADRESVRRELLAEIDEALRSDAAAMHHSLCWRNAGFGALVSEADRKSACFMADFIDHVFKP